MKLATPNRKRGRDASSQQGGRSALAALRCRRRGVAATLAPGRRRHETAFTLAEVLAAMLFLAIVIPVAVEALHVSSLAGEVAARKGVAARIADRVLNESLVMTNWTSGIQSGTVSEGPLDFKWTLTTQNWPQGPAQTLTPVSGPQIPMQMITAEVKYPAQGRDYSVTLSTLANLPNQLGTATTSMR